MSDIGSVVVSHVEFRRWRICWRCDERRHQLQVKHTSFNGDSAASERVARRLEVAIKEADDPRDREHFVVLLDSFIAEELVAMVPTPIAPFEVATEVGPASTAETPTEVVEASVRKRSSASVADGATEPRLSKI